MGGKALIPHTDPRTKGYVKCLSGVNSEPGESTRERPKKVGTLYCLNSLTLPYFFFYHIHLFNHPNHLLAQQMPISLVCAAVSSSGLIHGDEQAVISEADLPSQVHGARKLGQSPTFHYSLTSNQAALVFQGLMGGKEEPER